MQCPHCGADVLSGNTFCHRCRKRVTPPGGATAPRPALPTSPVSRPAPPPLPPVAREATSAPAHGGAAGPVPESFRRPGTVTALAVLSFLGAAFSALFVAAGAFVLVAGNTQRETDPTTLLVVVVYAVLGCLWLVNGIGLWTLKPWGRITQIVAAVLGLCGLPVGTIIAVLVLIYMTRPGVGILFSGRSPAELTPQEWEEVRKVSGGSGIIIVIALVLVVAFILIIAAIAIPSLLRARIAANESAAVGEIRIVVTAEETFARQNGGFYEELGCLMAPPQCRPDQLGAMPPVLDSQTFGREARHGYHFRFFPGAKPAPAVSDPTLVSPIGLVGYAYVAMPAQAGRTGIRSFCGDSSGVVCVLERPDDPALEQGACPVESCTPLGR